MRMKDQLAMGDKLMNEVYAKYHAGYNNDAFYLAIKRKGSAYANCLIDEALALCGSPYEKLSFRNWGKDAIAFLKKFAIEESGMSNALCNLAMPIALVVVLVMATIALDIPIHWDYLIHLFGL